jgi:hypothetical protein
VSTTTLFLGSGAQVLRAIAALRTLTFGPKRNWVLTLEPVDPLSTTAQKAKLRAMVGELARATQNDPEELYEVLLAGRFGTKPVKVRGATLFERPAKRFSDLGRKDASDYIEWVYAQAAHMGVTLR